MKEALIKITRLSPEEIKKRYGEPGEFAEITGREERQLKEDLYSHGKEAMRLMARGRRKPRE